MKDSNETTSGGPDLTKVGLVRLVDEIRRRSSASLVAVRLKDGASPEADIRIFNHADKGHSLELLGLAALAQDDVLIGARPELAGPAEREVV